MRWLDRIRSVFGRSRRARELARYRDALSLVETARRAHADRRSSNPGYVAPPPFPPGHPNREFERLGQMLVDFGAAAPVGRSGQGIRSDL